jgi:hypothetical protein
MKSPSRVLLSTLLLVPGVASAAKSPQLKLALAAKDGKTETVRKLLAEGVEPGGAGLYEDGIELAQYHGHTDVVKLLVDRCREVYRPGENCEGVTKWAARHGDVETLKFFLDKSGKDVNDDQDWRGSPALVYAAVSGNTANARYLIERGADIQKAIDAFEDSTVKLSAIDDDSARAGIAANNAGIRLLERLRPPKPEAPAAAAGGVSAAELERIVKSAVAASKAPEPAKPAAPAEPRSDVDRPAYKVAQNPDAYAIVVGVEKYNALPDAKWAERDAKAMTAHLVAMGYPQRNIVTLTGAQATRTGLVKNLEAWLPNQVNERSTVLFYFSGHGAPDAKSAQAYLVPSDGDPQYLEETGYPIKRLYEKLGALKAKRVLVALDSCFSGAGGRSVLASGTRPLVAKLTLAPAQSKVVSLSASSADEITGALDEQGHGLFTYHLLKALGETAGRGTVQELYDALKPRVADEARRQNRGQTPQLFGSADGGLR